MIAATDLADMAAPPARSQARIAALPMYDGPELQDANNALWAAIAARLRAAGLDDIPESLSRSGGLAEIWASPSLLLAQACGYPLVTGLQERVRLVATPRYVAPGCEGPFRRSAIIVRADTPAERLADLRGARCAVNDRMSDSGMNLLRAAVAPLADARPFFASVAVTGSHRASAESVAGGEADLAALDAVTYAHLRRHHPKLARRLRVLEWTDHSPGLPLISAASTDEATIGVLQDALSAVAADPRLTGVRKALRLQGFSLLLLSHYRLTSQLEERAAALGYPQLG